MKPFQSFYLDMKSIHGAADGVQGGDVSHRARLVAAGDDTKPGIKAGKTQHTPVDQSYRRFTPRWCQGQRKSPVHHNQSADSSQEGLDLDMHLLVSHVCMWVWLFTC